MRQQFIEEDLSTDDFDDFWEESIDRAVPTSKKQSRWGGLWNKIRRLGVLMRVAGLTVNPLPAPTLPPYRPPIVEQDTRPRGTQKPPDAFDELDTDLSDLMDYLADVAAEAERATDAEAFIGAMVPLMSQMHPRLSSTILRTAPNLINGLAAATRLLHRSPRTRPLLRTFPRILDRTAAGMQQQLARGRPVTPRSAVRILSNETQRTLNRMR